MFRDLCDRLMTKITGEHLLTESLSKADIARYRKELSVPDLRPAQFDITFEAWLRRIGYWGRVKIEHIDPEVSGRRKKKVSQREFINRVSDPELNRIFGTWSINQPDFHIVWIERDYLGLNGKKYKEKFIVTVDLRPDIKKAMKGRR